VISVSALTPILVCFHKLEITPPSNFNQSCDGTAARALLGWSRSDLAGYVGVKPIDIEQALPFDFFGRREEKHLQFRAMRW
jgi:hypothetical protein